MALAYRETYFVLSLPGYFGVSFITSGVAFEDFDELLVKGVNIA